MEISLIRNGRNVYNYNSKDAKNHVKTLIFTPLLVAPTSDELKRIIENSQRILEDTDNMMKEFNISPTPVKSVGDEWFNSKLPMASPQNTKLMDDIHFIADFFRTVKDFIKTVCYALAHPIEAILCVMELISPFMILFASVIPIIGLILLLFDVPKFGKWHTKSLIINPIITYIIYVVLTILLRSLF